MGYLFHAYLRIVPTFADNPAWIDEDELGMGKVTMHCSGKTRLDRPMFNFRAFKIVHSMILIYLFPFFKGSSVYL